MWLFRHRRIRKKVITTVLHCKLVELSFVVVTACIGLKSFWKFIETYFLDMATIILSGRKSNDFCYFMYVNRKYFLLDLNH